MARRLDQVITAELVEFSQLIDLYKKLRDIDKRRELAHRAGTKLLIKHPDWPTPRKWLDSSQYATKERVAWRSLMQAYERRVHRDQRLRKQERREAVTGTVLESVQPQVSGV